MLKQCFSNLRSISQSADSVFRVSSIVARKLLMDMWIMTSCCVRQSVFAKTHMLKGDKVHGFLKIKWYLFFSSMAPQPCRTKSKIILEATRWPSCSTFLVSVPICTSRKRTIASISVVSGTLVKTVKTVTKVYHLHLK